MFLVEFLLSIITFPVQWFWAKIEELNAEGNKGKAILLFVVSLSGLGLFLFVLFWIGNYLVTYHPALVVIIALIIWFYAWVKSKMPNKPVEVNTTVPVTNTDLNSQYQKAQHRQPVMDDVILAVAKAVALDIGCCVPNDIAEMYCSGYRIDDDGRFAYYVYRIEKKDYLVSVPDSTLKEYHTRLQYKTNHLIESGKFRIRRLPTESDYFGETLYGVHICSVFDKGQYLYIWALFDTPEYRNYQLQHGKDVTAQVSDTLPEARWDEYDI